MKKVLIAEDDYINAELFKHILINRLNHDVVGVAHTSQETLAMAENLRPDIILLDIRMEYKTAGIDACRILKKDFSGIKVILLTAYGLDIFEQDLEGVSYDGYIDKLNFSETIEKVLEEC